ncbi:hypothetical protein FB451DRAFT_1396922 [Mycena latifolia]|nr:hypothetical protein FB451DRAFT_1396922 [Mycena latifolia]
MAHLCTVLFGLLSALLISAAPSRNALAPRDLLGDVVNALDVGLVQSISITVTLQSLEDNLVSLNFDAKNPLPCELTIDSASATAGVNGTVYFTFDHPFSKPVVLPPLQTGNSGDIVDVLLTQGAEASLAIIPLGELDIINLNLKVRPVTFSNDRL